MTHHADEQVDLRAGKCRRSRLPRDALVELEGGREPAGDASTSRRNKPGSRISRRSSRSRSRLYHRACGLLFASSYFSVITSQGGNQNIIFAASGHLTQRELCQLGFFTTLAFVAVFLLIATPWVLFVTG